ncbi:MAG: alpha-2-macroglobulin, partial [Verrucomicrobiae bacterium]|nr:alpha-2-macroglobulin [Verrucomicrobiae bacterium]
MKPFLALAALILAGTFSTDAASIQEADKLAESGSYQKALEIYEALKPANAEEARAIAYKTANARWRSQAGSENSDDTQTRRAEEALKQIVAGEKHDRIWADANESLGDFYWIRRNQQNWGGAWPYYSAALDYWAGESDVEPAAKHYLQILWRAAEPNQPQAYYGYYGNYLPIEVLENAVQIAKTPEDQAEAHYLLAMSLRYQGGSARAWRRVPVEFDAALKLGKKTSW